MGIKEKVRSIWNSLFIPTSIEPIKFVLLFENILDIYRNLGYYEYNKKIRCLIYLRTMVDIGSAIVSVIVCAILVIPFSTTAKIIFYINGIASIAIITLAIVYSKKFSKLLTFIESNHAFFINDKEYHQKLLKQEKILKWSFFVTNVVAFFIYIFVYLRQYFLGTLKTNFLFIVSARMYDYRCIFEHVVIYTILYVISAQVECITRVVNNKKMPGVSIENKETKLKLKDFEQMFNVYSNIKKCSHLFNEIFGRQLVLMLMSAMAYCILFLYNLASLSVNGFHDPIGFTGSVIKLLTFFLPLLLVSWSAQQIVNNVNDLRCQLGKLLTNCEMNDAYYKATRGFLRLVYARSIQTKTCGSISVDMTLVPSFIMFVTSYTVIALQFNNIV